MFRRKGRWIAIGKERNTIYKFTKNKIRGLVLGREEEGNRWREYFYGLYFRDNKEGEVNCLGKHI